MLSNKPYLVRAFYDWIVDSGYTPFLVINTHFPRCNVPKEYIENNGEITLNVSPTAIRDLKITNDFVEFRASFSGVVHIISAPVKAILAIFAQEENQQGMFFDYEEPDSRDMDTNWAEPSLVKPDELTKDTKRRMHLKLVE